MNTTENEFDTVPTLTLDPFAGAAGEVQPAPQPAAPAQADMDDSMLSEVEKRQVEQFATQIDLTNASMILQYGAGTQKKMADFSETALQNVRTKDLGEIGDLLTGVVTELKHFDDEEEEKGFLGIFKKASNKVDNMKIKYSKAETNVNKICSVLEEHQVQLMKDVGILDKMYEANLNYFKELSMYILAGKKKLNTVRSSELPQLIEKAKTTNKPEDAQKAKDLDDFCNRFEKKLHDLELTRTISLQTAPQIRLVQSNDTMMVEKIQSTLVNTIPLWKSQMVITLGIEHSAQAARAQREVTNITNELLKKNAAALQMASVETAKESERGIVDIETLKVTNESLIATFDEVMRIQDEGRQKRREAESEIQRLEQDLKNKLLQIR